MRRSPEYSGFTLVEVLVAVIILALNQALFFHLLTPLAVMALPTTLFFLWHFFFNKRDHSIIQPVQRHAIIDEE